MKLISKNLQTLLSCLFCKTTFKGEHDNFFLDFSGKKKKKKKKKGCNFAIWRLTKYLIFWLRESMNYFFSTCFWKCHSFVIYRLTKYQFFLPILILKYIVLKDPPLNTSKNSCPSLVAQQKQCKISLGNEKLFALFSSLVQERLVFC